MLKFLNLIFSTSGCVGRATWWWMQLITLVLGAVLTLSVMHTSGRISHLSSVKAVKSDAYLQSLSIPERNKEKREMLAEDWNIIYALATALLFLLWAHICIEVKRWHDLGLSGYWVWIGIVPRLVHAIFGVLVGAVVSILTAIGVIYLLGFRDGVYDHSQEPEEPRSSFAVLNDMGGAVMLILLVVAAFKFGFISISPSDIADAPSLSRPESASASGD